MTALTDKPEREPMSRAEADAMIAKIRQAFQRHADQVRKVLADASDLDARTGANGRVVRMARPQLRANAAELAHIIRITPAELLRRLEKGSPDAE